MSKKKLNPHRIPITMNDVKRIKNEAVQFSWGAFMLALGDVAGLSRDEMLAVWDRVNEYERDYITDKLTLEYLHDTMAQKCGIIVPDRYGASSKRRSDQISIADLNRAKRSAIRFSWCVFMVALSDIGCCDKDQMRNVFHRMGDYEEDYVGGVLSIEDLRITLLDEYGIRLSEAHDG